MKLLDLSKMKKVAGDDKTTTFRHEDGHEMKILHGALSKIQQAQIKRIPTHKFAEGGEVDDSDTSSNDSGSSQPPTHAPVTINIGAPAAQAAPAPAPVQEKPPEPPTPGPATANPNQTATVPAQAVNTGIQAAGEQQAVDTTRAQGMEPIAQEQQQNAQTVTDRQNQTIADMKQHTDDFAQYLNQNPINSRKLLQDQSDEQKWQTGIGLFLGGLGGGGTSNVALDFLNKAIDRDVQSQKDNADQKKTVYGAYQHLYQDENVSTALTKVSMNDKVIADTNMLAAKLGTPQAQANRDALVSKLQLDNYKTLQEAAFLANQPGVSQQSPNQAAPAAGVEPSGKKAEYGPESADPTGVYNIQPILKPGAADMNNYQARTTDPASVSQYPRLQEQYAKAQKADEVLSRAKGIYSSLQQNATQGGWLSRQIGGGSLAGAAASIPVVGTAAAGVLGAAGQYGGEALTGLRKGFGKNGDSDEFSMNRQYDTAKQELGDLLRSVYPGISGGEYSSKLSAIVPDLNDKPEDIKKKMTAFEDLIKTSGEFNLLKNKGMAH